LWGGVWHGDCYIYGQTATHTMEGSYETDMPDHYHKKLQDGGD